MLIKCFPVGHLETNCYIVTDETTLECAVIDPGDESAMILDYIEQNHLKVRAILLTHGHFDHTTAARAVREDTGSVIWIHKRDCVRGDGGEEDYYRFLTDDKVCYFREGDEIEAGSLKFKVMELPGHSQGSVAFRTEQALFVGDVLFRGSCGRTDLPGGDRDQMRNSLQRLYELEGDFEVYPGHLEATTLMREKHFNAYMLAAVKER